uniref:Uncharacterized protein n=1 Tax=Vitrella brassicaformis TaxID=1169539 RepID=A0A7S1KFI5_9ALVE|mmetsp:Transcript_52213/g.131221  ORF Transcript_52213/g.131221 Transcript_52213/m.131221 type:complete len:126 (+) Transcript_52213:75-452(+)
MRWSAPYGSPYSNRSHDTYAQKHTKDLVQPLMPYKSIDRRRRGSSVPGHPSSTPNLLHTLTYAPLNQQCNALPQNDTHSCLSVCLSVCHLCVDQNNGTPRNRSAMLTSSQRGVLQMQLSVIKRQR